MTAPSMPPDDFRDAAALHAKRLAEKPLLWCRPKRATDKNRLSQQRLEEMDERLKSLLHDALGNDDSARQVLHQIASVPTLREQALLTYWVALKRYGISYPLPRGFKPDCEKTWLRRPSKITSSNCLLRETGPRAHYLGSLKGRTFCDKNPSPQRHAVLDAKQRRLMDGVLHVLAENPANLPSTDAEYFGEYLEQRDHLQENGYQPPEQWRHLRILGGCGRGHRNRIARSMLSMATDLYGPSTAHQIIGNQVESTDYSYTIRWATATEIDALIANETDLCWKAFIRALSGGLSAPILATREPQHFEFTHDNHVLVDMDDQGWVGLVVPAKEIADMKRYLLAKGHTGYCFEAPREPGKPVSMQTAYQRTYHLGQELWPGRAMSLKMIQTHGLAQLALLNFNGVYIHTVAQNRSLKWIENLCLEAKVANERRPGDFATREQLRGQGEVRRLRCSKCHFVNVGLAPRTCGRCNFALHDGSSQQDALLLELMRRRGIYVAASGRSEPQHQDMANERILGQAGVES